MSSERELAVWRRVADLVLSPSHSSDHITRVQQYADLLAGFANVDPEVARLAAILHDLGRGDQKRRHGKESIQASTEMAREILMEVDLSADERSAILEAIETHDQPDLSPPTVWGKILKDADFLAGFGAWGVLRIAMWSGETERSVETAKRRIGTGMKDRFDHLEFAISRESAFREVIFAQLFLAELNRSPQLACHDYPGRYVVLEGISGSGKNTVADAISDHLHNRRIPNRVVEEPGGVFRDLREKLAERQQDLMHPAMKKALFTADRVALMEQEIIPALKAGEVVIGVRSFLSTAVYQASTDAEACLTMLDYEWAPLADALLLLDVGVDEALNRIGARAKSPGEFETREDLARHRLRFRSLAGIFPARSVETIDAGQAEDAVVARALERIEPLLPVV